MRGSLVCHFKSFMSKIHPPLPLNPRESQKLVGLLKTSHKKQLDEKHPESSTGHFEATDAHFHALLSSPLFHAGPRNPASSEHAVPIQRLDPYESAQLQTYRALHKFDGSVAAGTMTLQELRITISTLVQSAKQLGLQEGRALLESSQAVEKIIHWLWASGADESREFLESKRFPKLLAPLLVSEAHEKFLWRWINKINQMLLENRIPSNYATRTQGESTRAYLIERVVKRRMLFGNGATDACEAFLAIFNQSIQDKDSVDVRRKVRRAGTYLVHSLCSRDKAKIEPRLFDAFVASCDHWSYPGLFRAMMLLHHPQGSRPEHGMQFLHKLKPHEIKVVSQMQQYNILRLALGTAKIMLEKQHIPETEWLMEFAAKYFPDETKVPSEVTQWSKGTSTSDIARFALMIEELVLPISTALRLQDRAHMSRDTASSATSLIT